MYHDGQVRLLALFVDLRLVWQPVKIVIHLHHLMRRMHLDGAQPLVDELLDGPEIENVHGLVARRQMQRVDRTGRFITSSRSS